MVPEDPGPRLTPGPLPPYAFLPGRDPHPTADPRGHSYGRPARPVQRCAPAAWRRCRPYLRGCDLFNHGYWWEAHEAWEPLWRGCLRHSVQAHYLQALIQAANALLKRRMGRERAVRRLRRAVDQHLAVVREDPYMGLAVGDWRAAIGDCLAEGNRSWPPLRLDITYSASRA